MAAEAANPPQPPAAPAPAGDQGLPLLDGDTLRDMLMGARKPAQQASPGIPRTTGNIWENWK